MDVTPVQITLWTSAFSLAGLLIGHRLRIGGDRLQRRRVFRGKLRSIAATLQSTKNPLIYDAYQKTVPEVRDLCANIRDDIYWLHRRSLDAACIAYCSLKEPEVRVSQAKGFFDNSVTSAERGLRFDKSRTNLNRLLQRIIKCA